MNSAFSSLLFRWLFTAVGVALAARVVPGIAYEDTLTLLVVVVLLSFFNAALRPLLLLMMLPMIILTAGLGVLLINALLFLLVGKLVDGFHVDGFWPAFWGAAIVSITSLLLSFFIGPKRGSRRQAPPPPPDNKKPPHGGGDVIDI